MRSFSVPFDLNTEEKTVGGYLTIKQTLYLVITAILTLILLITPVGGGSLADMIQGKVSSVIIVFKIVLTVLIIALGLLFMYLKPHGMSFAKYLSVRIKFMKRRKIIIYKR